MTAKGRGVEYDTGLRESRQEADDGAVVSALSPACGSSRAQHPCLDDRRSCHDICFSTAYAAVHAALLALHQQSPC